MPEEKDPDVRILDEKADIIKFFAQRAKVVSDNIKVNLEEINNFDCLCYGLDVMYGAAVSLCDGNRGHPLVVTVESTIEAIAAMSILMDIPNQLKQELEKREQKNGLQQE